jgi:hypothetical protein
LQTIQRVWKTGRGADEIVLHLLLLRNIHAIMTNVLTPLAVMLIHQELGQDDLVAAPCFNYYPIKDDGKPGDPLEPKKLHVKLVQLLAIAALATTNSDERASLEQIIPYVKTKIPAN